MTRSQTWLRPVAALAGFAIASALMVGPASARLIESGPQAYSFEDDIVCGDDEVPFHLDGFTEGRYQIVEEGRYGWPMYRESIVTTEVWTNLDTQITVTAIGHGGGGAVRNVLNDDGTVTHIIHAGVGTYTFYDTAGKAAAGAPGNFTVELVFNDNGTPTNLADDQFLSFSVTKEAGQTFDTCEVLLELTS